MSIGIFNSEDQSLVKLASNSITADETIETLNDIKVSVATDKASVAADKATVSADKADIVSMKSEIANTKTTIDETAQTVSENANSVQQEKIAIDETKTDIDKKYTEISNTASKLNTEYNNLTSNYYTKEATNSLISSTTKPKYSVVNELPTSDIGTDIIYLKSTNTTSTDGIYEMYTYQDSNWVKIGTSNPDLADYYTKELADSTFATKTEINNTNTEVSELKGDLTYVPLSVFASKLKLGQTVNILGEISNISTSALSSYIKVNTDEVLEFPDITDANGIKINFHLARYTADSTNSFISRDTANGKQIKIDSDTKYIRIMFSRPSASGVAITSEDVQNYFYGKIFNLGYETYKNIESLIPLLDRQIVFDASKLEIEWTLGRRVQSDGYIENTIVSATSNFINVYENEVFESPMIEDASGNTISILISAYDESRNFIERVKLNNASYKISNSTKYVRFSFSRPTASAITMTDEDIQAYFKCMLYQCGTRIQVGLSNKENDIDSDFMPHVVSTTWTLEKTVQPNGIESDSTTYALSDYIVRNGMHGLKTLEIVDGSNIPFNTLIACYDKHKRFIGRYSGIVMFDTDVVFYRIIFGRSSSTGIVPTQNTISTYFAIEKITSNYIQKSPKWDIPNRYGVVNAINRAKQLVFCQYKTKAVLPNQVSDIPANTTVTGVPYSSVRLYDKFIGLNVSLHTFMTAINNPRSVIYTESLATPNAKTYYGTVCSSFTAYALGSPVREVTKKILANNVDYTTKYINDISVGDICVNDGHIIMIAGIERDIYGRITNINVVESLPPKCMLTSYAWSEFIAEFNQKKYRLASYNHIGNVEYNNSKYVPLMDEKEEDIIYSAICTNWGDAPLLRKGESVTINILDSTDATGLEIYKDGTILSSEQAVDYTINNLDVGEYEARLIGSSETIATTTWSVCYATVIRDGDRLSFTFSDNCRPLYVSVNDETGSAYYCKEITESDIENGYIDIDYHSETIKVVKIYVGNDDSSTSFTE